MKNNIVSFFLFSLMVTLICCNRPGATEQRTLINLNIEKNSNFHKESNLKYKDLKLMPLDDRHPDSFFKDALILDLIGDTIFIIDNDFMPTKILKFNISNGDYLGQINHQGDGPGEYRIIYGAFIDSLKQSVLIPDIDRLNVYSYSVKNDSLFKIYDRPDIPLQLIPTGNTEECINLGIIGPDCLSIIQFNPEFEEIDSVFINDFQGSPFSSLWAQSGKHGVLFYNDTLSTIVRGHLDPLVSLKMGKYKLNDDEARDAVKRMIESTGPDSDVLKELRNYILVREFQFTTKNLLITYIYNESKWSDFYDLQTGVLLNRFKCDNYNSPSKIVLDLQTGESMVVERLFTKNDIWYGISNEIETAKLLNLEPSNAQATIVSFTIK